MEDTLIVGVGHKARHGKDTVAKILHSFSPMESRIFSFAADLKGMCRVVHGMRDKDAPLLQREGSRFRETNPDIFVECLEAQIRDEAPKIAIIPDMRYKNEMEWIKNRGGITVRVSRLNVDGTPFIDPSRPADHPSEIDLDDAEFHHEVTVKTGEVHLLAGFAAYLWQTIADKVDLPPPTSITEYFRSRV